MNKPNSSRPVSPELERLQTPEQNSIRTFLRKIGPLVFIAGLLCTIGGMISFFSSFGSFEPPRYFWLCFVGLPLIFFGGVMSQFGFMGAVARFMAGEAAPVAKDTINYMAEETRGTVEMIARSAAKGVGAGIEAGSAIAERSFCSHCGLPVQSDFKFCPKCGKSLMGV